MNKKFIAMLLAFTIAASACGAETVGPPDTFGNSGGDEPPVAATNTPVPSPTLTNTPTPTPTDTPTPTPTPIVYTYRSVDPVVMYTLDGVNVREKPDSFWNVIAWLYEGTEVTVIEQCIETGWYHVVLPDGTEGYSSSDYYTEAVPAHLDISTVDAVPVPSHTSSGSFSCNLGESPVFTVESLTLTAFRSYDESVLLISADGVITPRRAGSTVISCSDGSSVLFFDVTVYDRHRLEGQPVTNREITDDLWLLEDVTIGDSTFVRSTGLKLIGETETGYSVTCGSIAFTVTREQVTDVCPAVTPTPPLPDTGFDISPGTLVNFDYVILSAGQPNGLVDIGQARTTRALKADGYPMFAGDAINALSVLARDCVNNGGSYFIIDATSGYRWFEMQDNYWKKRIADDPAYGDDPYANGGTKCVPAVSSEHRTGYAADVVTAAEGYDWLNDNCWKYGFIHRYVGAKTGYTGVMDEYWHYTYVGRDVAETCYKEGLCLEEYYAKYVFTD